MSSTNAGPSTTTTNNAQSPISNVQQIATLSVGVGTLSGVAANTTAEQTVTVTGLATTDVVMGISKPTHQAGLGITNGRVSAANTLAIEFINATTASITPTASETYSVTVLRPVANLPALSTMPAM